MGRAFGRYSDGHGGLLAGGVAYSMLFSLFGALTVGYTIFAKVLEGNPELEKSVTDVIANALPGIIDSGDGSGGAVTPDQLIATNLSSWTGIIAFIVLVVSASSGMGALRASVRQMFAADESAKEKMLVSKLREFASLVGLGVAVLISAVLTLATTSILDWLLDLMNMSDSIAAEWLARIGALTVAFIVDALAFIMIFKLLAGVKVGRRSLMWGALIGAAATSVLQVFSTTFIGNVGGKNALLASFAVLATLLVWINLLIRTVLLTAAWTADPPPPPD